MGVVLDSIVLELLALVVVGLLAYKCWILPLNYWKAMGIPHVKPIPFFGNYKDNILSHSSEAELVDKLYRQLNGEKFGGIFQGQTPVLLLRDPELIKQILVKDFSVFPARNIEFDEKIDPLSAHIFNLEGDRWKTIRSKLTPAFTPRKLKCMFPLLTAYAEDLCSYLERHAFEDGPIEMKRVLTRFSTDVLCSSLFGLEANAMNNPDSQFYNIGEKIVTTSENSFHRVRSAISRALGRQSEVNSFFCSVAEDITRFREEHGTASNDFMHLLAQLRNDGDAQGLSTETMAAQMYICFLAGFEKPPAVLSACLLELAQAPALQARLRAELDSVTIETGHRLEPEHLHKMPYLDRVVAETLRKYPVEANLTRVSRRPYTIPGTSVDLPEGTRVIIPVFAIQRDPQYYPDPELFDPDRPEGPSATYLPFGQGPRMCIGYKFGLMQIKVALATLLSKYEFIISSRTRVPAQLVTKGRITSLAKGAWLHVKLREVNTSAIEPSVNDVKDGELASPLKEENIISQSNINTTDSSASLELTSFPKDSSVSSPKHVIDQTQSSGYEFSGTTVASELPQKNMHQLETQASSFNDKDSTFVSVLSSDGSAILREEVASQRSTLGRSASRKKSILEIRTRDLWQNVTARVLRRTAQHPVI